jgi:REP element-mobilizing transposase RayT
MIMPGIDRMEELYQGVRIYQFRVSMPQSLARIYIHLIFSTKYRTRWIPDDVRPALHAYMAAILKDQSCLPVCINTEPDHAHLLFELGRMVRLGTAVGQVKKGSTIWLRSNIQTMEPFRWQSGYGAFSVGRHELPGVMRYIRNQREHHKGSGYEAEFRSICRKYGIQWDERYVWD